MLKITIEAPTAEDLKLSLQGLLETMAVKTAEPEAPIAEAPKPIAPVVPQKEVQQEAAPIHEEPKQPTIEEVRAALKELRDRKGSAAVKELLKAFQAESLTELKQEDYLGALARAKTEV